MSNIPIVQGVAVSDAAYSKTPDDDEPAPTTYQTTTSGYAAAPMGDEHRETPRKQYQDVIWAVAFLAHLIAVMVVIVLGLQSSNTMQGGGYYSGVLVLVGITGATAVGLSCSALSFMMNQTETLVQTALIFSVASSLAVGIVGFFVVGTMWMGILGLVSFAIGLCYAKIVWPRIPYAAANLQTAVSAVQANLGLAAVALGFTGLAFCWTLLWFLGLGDALAGSKLPVVFLLVGSDSCCETTGCCFERNEVLEWRVLVTRLQSCYSRHSLFFSSFHSILTNIYQIHTVLELLLGPPSLAKHHACHNRRNGGHLVVHSRRSLLVVESRLGRKLGPRHDLFLWFHLLWQLFGGVGAGTAGSGTLRAR